MDYITGTSNLLSNFEVVTMAIPEKLTAEMDLN
jgi:hypothetical protein